MPPTAYSYLRFSSAEQAKGDSYRRQFEKAKRYSETNGLELVTSSYQDLGISAYRGLNLSVGALGEFIKGLEEGKIEQGSYLLVEALDRLSRGNAIQAAAKLQEICSYGVTVVTLVDGQKYTHEALSRDPTTILVSVLGFLRANEESAVKQDRLLEVWSSKRRSMGDTPMTAKLPLWLRLNREANLIEVIPERAAMVREAFERYLSGEGPGAIAAGWNVEGRDVWGSGKRKSAFWHRSYVSRLLDNPAVFGQFTPCRMTHEGSKKVRVPLDPVIGYFPAVVDEETFLRAKAIREGQGAGLKGKKTFTEAKNILARLVNCPKCGSPMSYAKRDSRGRRWRYLVCASKKNKAGCSFPVVRYDTLEETMLSAIRGGLSVPVDQDRLRGVKGQIAETLEKIDQRVAERGHLIHAIKQGLLRDDHEMMTDVERPVLAGVEQEGAVWLPKSGSFTLREEIEFMDRVINANKKRLAELRAEEQLLRPEAVFSRVAALQTAAVAPDRGAVNGLLRELLRGVELVDGGLLLNWRHTSEQVFVGI